MLVPAILYADEIHKKFMEYTYSDDMLNYSGTIQHYTPNIANNEDNGRYEYAIVDNDKLIGYFTYHIDFYVSCINRFGLFSFDRNNPIVGINVYKEITKVINQYNIHRMEWRMVGGNAVEKHYDRFCQKHHGRKIILIDAIRDKYGKYHNDIIYEIIFSGAKMDKMQNKDIEKIG